MNGIFQLKSLFLENKMIVLNQSWQAADCSPQHVPTFYVFTCAPCGSAKACQAKMCTQVAYWGTVSKALVVLLWYIHAGPSPGVAFTLVWAVSVTGCGGCTGVTGDVTGRKYHLKNPGAAPRISVMSGTFMESSLMDCTGERLDSCVSEIMKGLEPASRTLWTFPESAWARDRAVISRQNSTHCKRPHWGQMGQKAK